MASEGSNIAVTICKKIPSRNVKIVIEWWKREFMAMSQRFREIRSRSKNPMDACGLCKHKFVDGEMMGLGCFETTGNKVLCGKCCDELESLSSASGESHE